MGRVVGRGGCADAYPAGWDCRSGSSTWTREEPAGRGSGLQAVGAGQSRDWVSGGRGAPQESADVHPAPASTLQRMLLTRWYAGRGRCSSASADATEVSC